MQLNVADLLKPVSKDSSCGSNLEYDPRFLQLDELAEGVPEKQMGDSVIDGRDPDWNELRKNSLELLNETKDLRIALFLTLSELNLDGLPGFDQGLQVLSGLLDNFWDTVYPELDTEDNNDPQERINCVMSLSPEPGSYRDPMMFIQRLRSVPLCKSSNLGKYTLYDVLTSDGSLESENPAELKLVRAAFLDTPPELIESYRNNVLSCIKSVETIKRVFAEQADDHLDFSLLLDSLNVIVKAYDDFAMSKNKNDSAENSDEDVSVAGVDEGENVTDSAAVNTAKSSSSPKNNGKITNRQQAVVLLNKISKYFESAEPSSPAPYFIKRAIRTAGMNFMDIVSDISPAGLEQANTALKPAELIISESQNKNEPGASRGAPAKEAEKEPEGEKAFNPFA